jgi:type I restriction enzyme M protein
MAGITYPEASGNSGGGLDFEAQLWAAADKMRGHMDTSEYKPACLSLIFLKYISGGFAVKREQLWLERVRTHCKQNEARYK